MADQTKPQPKQWDEKDALTDLPEAEVAPKNAEEVKGGVLKARHGSRIT